MQRLTSKRWLRWLLGGVALMATVAMATYQRPTGPTWPIPVRETLAGVPVSGRLIRTQPGQRDARVAVEVSSGATRGELVWRRYPTDDPWSRIAMQGDGSELFAMLPNQPPAAKLEYSVRLWQGAEELVLPHGETAIIRFRDEVPAWVLIPHILVMFLTLWIAFRAALGALLNEMGVRRFIPSILALLVFGGFFLGPVVQKYAFDAWWTGWPFGGDWTDNKTLAAFLAWLVAWGVCRQSPQLQRPAVLLATVVMVIVYLIPHSIHGSQLDWSQVEENAGSGSAPAPEAPQRPPD